MSISTSLIQFLIFCSFLFVSQSTNTNFTFHGFNDTHLNLKGATVIKPSGALRLTNSSNFVIGHAFYPTPIPFLNSSFSTHFIFQINPSSTSTRGGYGLAFTLSQSPAFPGAAAEHFMGVFNESNDGNSSNHVFMVEFDTVNGYNENLDSEGNHVGINLNGMYSVASKPASYLPEGSREKEEEVYLENKGPVQAWIDYNGMIKQVNVTVAPLSIDHKPSKPLLSVILQDMSNVLLENMYAGFSAATGHKSSSHYILGWSFCLDGKANELQSSLLPLVPVVQTSSSNSSKLRTALIATFSAVLFVLVASLIGIVLYRRVMRFEVLEDWEVEAPHRFRYKDLCSATKGFKDSQKIGEGGFGAVYRGVLPSTGGEVAVKKIMNNNSLQGMREFAAEIESLGKLRQKNLVNLQGWCKHKNELLLVYDHLPNGSLDSLLYKSNSVLSWEQRFNIIKGVASGLLYLHEEWEKVVIHRDVKSSNVLIDGDMNPRLGDFGLARLYDHGKNSHTTNVVGTIGYIAPELSRTGQASTSTDVFAYGILLLEVACGRAAIVREAHQNVILVDWVVECMQMGRIFDAVDAKLNAVYVVQEMELVLGLGLLCSHPKPESRPTMRQVMKYLNGDEILPLFQRLTSAGSPRVDEVTTRFLELGLTDTTSYTPTTTTSSTSFYHSSSIGALSANSFGSAR